MKRLAKPSKAPPPQPSSTRRSPSRIYGENKGGPQDGGYHRDNGSAYYGSADAVSHTLLEFRDRYPMNDDAWANLSSAPAEVQDMLVAQFQPKREGELDYSGLVMSVLKKMRSKVDKGQNGEGFGRDENQWQDWNAGRRSRSPARKRARRSESSPLESFRERYPMNDDAWQELTYAPNDIVDSVLTKFKPRQEGEQDYSGLIISFVRSMKKKAFSAPPPVDALDAFRERYPMSASAWEELTSAPGEVVDTFLNEFKPKSEGDEDYSGLIVKFLRSIVKKFAVQPPLDPLDAFRARYPMRDAAWEELTTAPDEVIDTVLNGFKPRQEGEEDYTGLLLRFIRSIKRNKGVPSGPSVDPLEAFHMRYPMQERAWQELTSAPDEVIDAVLQNFQPRQEGEGDYTGLIISFIKSVKRKLALPTGPSMDPLDVFRERYPMNGNAWQELTSAPDEVIDAVLNEFKPRQEGDEDYSALIISFTRSMRKKFASAGPVDPLDLFRERYPMREDVWQDLASASDAVIDTMLAEFKPRQEGEQDYSSLILAFLRKVKKKEGEPSQLPPAPLDAFRERYPMNDNAWQELISAPDDIVDAVLNEFRPRKEGEGDYSGLIISFLRSRKKKFKNRDTDAPPRPGVCSLKKSVAHLDAIAVLANVGLEDTADALEQDQYPDSTGPHIVLRAVAEALAASKEKQDDLLARIEDCLDF